MKKITQRMATAFSSINGQIIFVMKNSNVSVMFKDGRSWSTSNILASYSSSPVSHVTTLTHNEKFMVEN